MKVVNPQKKTRRPCPDCGEPLTRRSSTSLSPLISRTLLLCRNHECGASFAGNDEITHRLNQPINRNPEIKLPSARKKSRNELFKGLESEWDINAPANE